MLIFFITTSLAKLTLSIQPTVSNCNDRRDLDWTYQTVQNDKASRLFSGCSPSLKRGEPIKNRFDSLTHVHQIGFVLQVGAVGCMLNAQTFSGTWVISALAFVIAGEIFTIDCSAWCGVPLIRSYMKLAGYKKPPPRGKRWFVIILW